MEGKAEKEELSAPPKYEEEVKEEIDNVHFKEEWAQKDGPDGYKFIISLRKNGGLSVWGENKTSRTQFELLLSKTESEKLINNNAIGVDQFYLMLLEGLSKLKRDRDEKKEEIASDSAAKEEIWIEARFQGDEGGITLALTFSPSRFMKQQFLIIVPKKETDPVDILTAQMRDVWSWKRTQSEHQAIIGKWTATKCGGNGNRMHWDTECFNTNAAFTVDTEPNKNTSRIRLNTAGLYKVEIQVMVLGGANTNHIHLEVNDKRVASSYASAQSNWNHTLTISDFVNANAEDYIEVKVHFGHSLHAADATNRLMITRLGDRQ